MSRIGNRKIEVPAGVTVKEENGIVTVTGPKGSLSQKMLKGISMEQKDNETPQKIEVVTGDGNLKISPVYEHLEVEKPRPKENRKIFILPNNSDLENKKMDTKQTHNNY